MEEQEKRETYEPPKIKETMPLEAMAAACDSAWGGSGPMCRLRGSCIKVQR